MNKNIVIIFISILLLFGLVLWYSGHPLQTTVTINGHVFVAKLAVTENEKRKGLGGQQSLAESHGMLFLMGEPAYHGFWMKDMKFPLDFIWINDKTVVDVTQNVPNPVGDSEPVSLKPHSPADKILEINAGEIIKYHIAIGNVIKISN